MQPAILLVDDYFPLLLSLRQALQDDYAVEMIDNGVDALRRLQHKQYCCVVLDIGMPDLDGLQICSRLRQMGNAVPIIILSAEDNPNVKAELLDAGANDYIVKPVSAVELKARLRNVARHYKPVNILAGKLQMSGVLLDSRQHLVTRDGVLIQLRRKEFSLLECLMNHAGQVVSRAVLMQYAWDKDVIWEKIVDVHVKYLRDKLDQPFDKPLIKTVHGLGYRFEVIKSELK